MTKDKKARNRFIVTALESIKEKEVVVIFLGKYAARARPQDMMIAAAVHDAEPGEPMCCDSAGTVKLKIDKNL